MLVRIYLCLTALNGCYFSPITKGGDLVKREIRHIENFTAAQMIKSGLGGNENVILQARTITVSLSSITDYQKLTSDNINIAVFQSFNLVAVSPSGGINSGYIMTAGPLTNVLSTDKYTYNQSNGNITIRTSGQVADSPGAISPNILLNMNIASMTSAGLYITITVTTAE